MRVRACVLIGGALAALLALERSLLAAELHNRPQTTLLPYTTQYHNRARQSSRHTQAENGHAVRAAHVGVVKPDAARLGASSEARTSSFEPLDSSFEHANHTELWGDLIESGEQNLQPSLEACARSCSSYEPVLDVADGRQCNTFVWHPHKQQCWLKHQKPDGLAASRRRLAEPRADAKAAWSSGVWLGSRPCPSCVVPTRYSGCITKTLCNTTRECGSPAIDGYSHVETKCFRGSRTNRVYAELLARGAELEAFSEIGADYDGLGVQWGIGNYKATWQACEAACRSHRPKKVAGPFSSLPCNTWTWCSQKKCFEPDAHSHSFGDCWLKFQELPEEPEVNMRNGMLPSYLRRHRRELASGMPWVSGVLLPPGTRLGKGTWGPRAYW